MSFEMEVERARPLLTVRKASAVGIRVARGVQEIYLSLTNNDDMVSHVHISVLMLRIGKWVLLVGELEGFASVHDWTGCLVAIP